MEQEFFNISPELKKLDKEALERVKDRFDEIDSITEYNQIKMLHAFINNGVSESHLGISTGYGYGDRGREVLDLVFAEAVGAEAALVRHNFVSGTHALTVALFGVLRPSDTVLFVTGRPYDTLQPVLGINGESSGSLKEFGVNYDEVPLVDGRVDLDAIKEKVSNNKYKMVYIQRSRGYSLRPSLLVEDIEKICTLVKKIDKDCILMVDNCYGEFTQKTEPTQHGADLMAGSLIKNAGGGIAPTGGYIAGRADLVEQCSYRLTIPGAGAEVGATLGHNRELYMGIFNAPHVTGEAMKMAVYASSLLSLLGYEVTPSFDEKRGDIIQAVVLGDKDKLIRFCQGMQTGAPVDSFVVPEAWAMPGYDCDIIMAAGAFTLGASVELSADAPLREPYAAWMQGGLNFHSAHMGVLLAVDSMLKQ